MSVSDSCVLFAPLWIHQVMMKTMKSGWLILQMKKTQRETAAS